MSLNFNNVIIGGTSGGGGVPINNQNITVTENGEYTAESGYTGLGTVTVNTPVINNQDMTITENGEYTATSPYTGLGTVTVSTPVINNENLTVTENGEYTASEGYTGLGTVTVEVQSGGSIGNGQFMVKVIDYDGTILKLDYLNTGDTFELPNAPTHTGLVFQEWSSTETITNNTITVGKRDVFVGAIYGTASEMTEIDLYIVPNITVNLAMNGTKDWGDGTSDTATSHTYSNTTTAQHVTIKCDGDTFSNASNTNIFSTTSGNPYVVGAIRFGKNVSGISQYAFSKVYGIKYMTIPNTLSGIANYAFSEIRGLKCVITPSSMTSGLGKYAFQYAYGLETIIMPYISGVAEGGFMNCESLKEIGLKNATLISNYAFQNCYSLINVGFPPTIQRMLKDCFYKCYSMKEYNFREATTVPELEYSNDGNGTRYFNGSLCVLQSNAGTLINVPQALLSSWQSANNWSNFAGSIKGV